MNYYDWIYGAKSGAVVMDEKRKIYRRHPDKTPCYAKDPKDCPIIQQSKRADEADDVTAENNEHGGSTSPIQIPSQENLYDTYEQEGVSPKLVGDIRAFHDAVTHGKIKPLRMPSQAFSNTGLPMWMLGAYYVASNYPDDTTANRVLTDFAKASGNYIGDTLEYCTKRYGESVGSGMESTVFDAGENVVKASSLALGSQETMQKVERLMLGNQYFPDTKNNVVGLGVDPTNELSFVLEQPKVHFDQSEPMTEDEVKAWAKEQGFEMRDEFLHNCSSPGNDLACMDMHNENVVRTNDGKIVCIDPCVIPNVYELDVNHGTYDYDEPPEQFE